jgi:2-polyprenyl-3-methyl-5-hydroxy-6-metoxy-1,4-benzoquinol methylase
MNTTTEKKSYYHAHESAYKNIKEKGYVGWGNVKTIEDLGDHETNQFLISSLNKWIIEPSGKKALDLGCGTGTTAFVLSKLGFDVTGIDISETAIEMAQELSLQQKLSINFTVGDILELPSLKESFQLIYDSHCLHCIVFEEDRMKVLNGVYNSTSDSGLFILDTMVMDEYFDATGGVATLRFDDDFILWHKTNTANARGVVEVNGQLWCPQRRIYQSSKVLEEIEQAGFIIKDKRLDKQGPGDPWMLRLVLGKF